MLTLIVVAMMSCGREDYKTMRYECSCEEQAKVSSFIQSSIKNANNMSDEEMEDVIIELRRTGIKTTCHQRLINYTRQGMGDWNLDWENTKIDSCQILYEDLY